MPVQTKTYLKQKFESGDKPTQEDFHDLIDSTYNTEGVNTLPSMTTESGKFLTTNGTSAIWADVTTNIVDITYADLLAKTKTGTPTANAVIEVTDLGTYFDTVVVAGDLRKDFYVGQTVQLVAGEVSGDYVVETVNFYGTGNTYVTVTVTENLPAVDTIRYETGSLVVGQKYRIIDYITYFDGVFALVQEPLIVTAITISELSPLADSALHPTDILKYSLYSPNTETPDVEFKGYISYRECPVKNIICHHDWRYGRRNLSLVLHPTEDLWCYLYDYPESNRGEIEPQSIFLVPDPQNVYNFYLGSNVNGPEIPLAIFRAGADKVHIGHSPDTLIVNRSITDCFLGDCSGLYTEEMIYGIVSYTGTNRLYLGGWLANSTMQYGGVNVYAGGYVQNCYFTSGLNVYSKFMDMFLPLDEIMDITYTDLKIYADNRLLIKEKKYRITDFAITHYLSDGTQVTGPIEPIVVTAISTSQLYDEAFSETYPTDKIRYVLNRTRSDGIFPDPADNIDGFKGWITYREEPTRNIISYHDWRHCKVLLWSIEVEFGVGDTRTIWVPDNPDETGGLNPYPSQAFTMIEAVPEGTTIIDIYIDSQVGIVEVPAVVFFSGTQKIKIGTSTDACIFNGIVYDGYIGSCCKVICYDQFYSTTVYGSSNIVFKRDSIENTLGNGVNVVCEGDITRCQFMNGYTNNDTNILEGDHNNELIGYPDPSFVQYTSTSGEVPAGTKYCYRSGVANDIGFQLMDAYPDNPFNLQIILSTSGSGTFVFYNAFDIMNPINNIIYMDGADNTFLANKYYILTIDFNGQEVFLRKSVSTI